MRNGHLFIALTLAGIGTLTDERWQSVPAAPVAASFLHISAVAVDRNERPVTNLKKEDLEVWIGGYRVPIEQLTLATDESDERSGRLTVLLLDDMTLQPALTSRVREIARRFVNRMAPGDQMAVVTLNGQGMESTSDRTRLLRSIDTFNLLPAATASAGLRSESTSSRPSRRSRASSRSSRAAVRRSSGSARPGSSTRRFLRRRVGRELRAEWTDAMRATASADAHLYVIDPSGSRRVAAAERFERLRARDRRPCVPEYERLQRRRRSHHARGLELLRDHRGRSAGTAHVRSARARRPTTAARNNGQSAARAPGPAIDQEFSTAAPASA